MYNRNIPYSKYNNVNISETLPKTDSTIPLGFLDVKVLTEGGIPIENAVVTLYILDRFKGEAPIQIGLTDKDGNSPRFSVPTSYNISNIIGQDFYFTTYNLRIDAVGYYSVQTNNIRFYPGILTVLAYDLIPIPIKIPGVNLEQRIQLPQSKFD